MNWPVPTIRRVLEALPETFSFVGPCTTPRAGDVPWSPPADGAPVALVSLGTLNNHWPDFYRLVFEALPETISLALYALKMCLGTIGTVYRLESHS